MRIGNNSQCTNLRVNSCNNQEAKNEEDDHPAKRGVMERDLPG